MGKFLVKYIKIIWEVSAGWKVQLHFRVVWCWLQNTRCQGKRKDKMSQKKRQVKEGGWWGRSGKHHYALRQVQHQGCCLSQSGIWTRHQRASRAQQSPGESGLGNLQLPSQFLYLKTMREMGYRIVEWKGKVGWLVCNFYFLFFIFSLPSGWYSTFKSLKEGLITRCLCRDFRFSTFLSASSR